MNTSEMATLENKWEGQLIEIVSHIEPQWSIVTTSLAHYFVTTDL